ncbi:MAG: 4-hydroxy-3-methylbut-2-enyl diphosphate reductase [Bacteroidales bacterium]|nr:4-hydroxy-3-methylbut-2-enyl diphosphate reductase [Bacteroidales bacterium]
MKIEIDPGAGFCFGVQRAIQLAEMELDNGQELFSLGQIVHNESEEKRLNDLGMKTITYKDFGELHEKTVLIRAHGEPPSTYDTANKNRLTLIEATCPIVTKLQQKIRKVWIESRKEDLQIVIVGKKAHPEVIGLAGQTNFQAIIIESLSDIEKVDHGKSVYIFAQTTVDADFFEEVVKRIYVHQSRRKDETDPAQFALMGGGNPRGREVTVQKSICNHVKNRKEQMIQFAREHDLVIFVGGKKSSNGQYLYGLCRLENLNSVFIENEAVLKPEWFAGCKSVGITGATSTPPWLLEKVKQHIKTMIKA